MNNSDQETDLPMSFYERYADFSDQQIKEILKNHRNYQEAAITAAVKIAIERKLIHTEQDLMSPEYQTATSESWSLFPPISIAYHHKRLVASIFRVLFITSFIPIIFGVLKYAEGELKMTYLGVGLGLMWMIFTFILLKTKKLIVLFLQVIMVILVFIILGKRLLSQEVYQIADIFVLVVGTMLLLYFLFYLKKLILTKPGELSGQ